MDLHTHGLGHCRVCVGGEGVAEGSEEGIGGINYDGEKIKRKKVILHFLPADCLWTQTTTLLNF